MNAEKRSGDKDPKKAGAIAADETAADTTGVDKTDSPRPTETTRKAAPPSSDLPDDQEVLRTEIEETRADLGETVEALSAKADVKGQMKDKVEARKAQLRDQQAQAQAKLRDQQAQAKAKFGEIGEQAKSNPGPYAAAAGGAVALLLVVRRLRKRR